MKTHFFCSLALITALNAPFVYAGSSATSDSFKADAGIKYESGKYGGLQDTVLTTLIYVLILGFH